jgi:hypothetical protein
MRVSVVCIGVLLVLAAVLSEGAKTKKNATKKETKRREAEDRIRKQCDHCHTVVSNFQRGQSVERYRRQQWKCACGRQREGEEEEKKKRVKFGLY